MEGVSLLERAAGAAGEYLLNSALPPDDHPMSEPLKPEQFSALSAPLTLSVNVAGVVSTVELKVLSLRPRPPHAFRDAPFSMTLAGPRAPLLPQGTYPVRHPELGIIQLFLVPAAQDAESTQYEVTFN